MIQSSPKKERTIRKKYGPQFKDQALERASKEGIPQAAKDLVDPTPF